jgi:hypothetical protein
VLFALLGGLVLPGAFVAAQLAQVVDEAGCPAHLVPSPGALKLRLFYEDASQARALDAGALAHYLADRFGRTVAIVGVEHTDEVGFRLAAAARPLTDEMLAFFAYRPSFPNVPTAHGMVDALGFATPGSACAYVSFLPSQPLVCQLADAAQPVQASYAYLAHEMGHLMGLAHAAGGIMGRGVFDLCHADRFSDGQLAQLQRWGV